LGVADDRFELSPWVRLAGQFFVGAAVVVTCPVHLPGVAAATTIIVVSVLLINGVNLLDGLDLLAGGVVAVAALAFALLLGGWGRHLGVALAARSLASSPTTGSRPGLPRRRRLVPPRHRPGRAPGRDLGAGRPGLTGGGRPGAGGHPGGRGRLRRGPPLRGHRSLVTGDRAIPTTVSWHPDGPGRRQPGLRGHGRILATAAVIAGLRASVAAAMVVDVAGAALLVASAAVTGALAPDEDART